MPNNNAELLGWLFVFLLNTILPLFIFLILKFFEPDMEWKRSIAFYVGWIPGNFISCWYLHYSIGFLNAFMIFFLCQVIQAIFVAIMARMLVKMFGFNAFP